MVLQTQKISGPLKILLVEDNLGDATLAFVAFKDFKTPVNLIRVKDGEDAITYLKKEREYVDVCTPDLILLDLNMPKKSGLEVLEGHAHPGRGRRGHVGDDEPPIPVDEARMPLRHVALRQHQIVALDAADADLRLVERLALLRTTLLADHDGEHGSLGTAAVREHS